MFSLSWIAGFVVGLNYFEDEELGFVVNLCIGFICISWYKDLERVE